MLSWQERPVEYANLFNPAFCSILLYNAIKGYQKEKKQGMPYPLIFLVLPLVLHQSTRNLLPRTTRTKLHIWLQNKPEVRVKFSDRTSNLVPHTKEALAFGMQTGIIGFGDDGKFTSSKSQLKNISAVSWSEGTEPAICFKKAEFIGRWFAQAGEVSTIYIMWGICP
ncbi:three component ABC system middle component [Calothrix sp. UHCC 0171]|uniref:three component ABC system middle component n=1 Tax=Calothrix sp. UHCC 0171 TaxID=3110245 RepID=UPI002B214464|nr:three component ABC system middle component [Calothrix sp. UHCC 0171]MEA5573496.1 three component ABC system middle component [Calothrix sp. UHCC 0171]